MKEERPPAEALALASRRLQEIQALATLGSWETDLATLAVTWTAETFRIFETSPDAFTPTHPGFLERVHPDDRQMVDEAFHASFGQPGPFALEHRLLFPDGRIKFVEERWQTFNDASGRPERAVGTCQDITSRKQTEQAMARSEASLVRAQRVARLGNWDWNIVTDQLYWSAMVFELFGIDPSGAPETYARFINGVHPEDRARTHHAVMEAVAGRAPYDIEHRVLWPDGTVRFMHELGEVTRDAAGRALSMIGTVQDITSRKQAEERLLKLSQAVEQSPATIVITDLAGTIEYVNPKFTEVSGYAAAEVIGSNPRILKSGKNPPELYRELWDTITAGKRWHGELQNRKKNGDTFWEEASIAPVLDAAGNPTHYLAVKEDITERKQAEVALTESAERFRLMVEGSEQVFFYTHDRDGRFTYLSPSTREVLGYAPDELTGALFETVLMADDPRNAAVHAHTDRALQEGTPGDPYPAIVRHKDGRRMVLELSEAPVVRAGQVVGLQGFARDITARERAREELEESEVRFRSLFDQAAVGMCLVSTEGVFLRANERLCAILGYSAEEMSRHTCVELTHPDDRDREAVMVARLLAGEMQTAAWEKRYLHQDGHTVWCNLTLSLLPPMGDQPQQFVGVIEDITERRRAQTALADNEARLRLALAAADIGTFDWDIPDNRIIWSRRHEELWGYAAGEFGGTFEAFAARVHPEDLPEMTAEISRCQAAGERFARDFRVVWPDGSLHWIGAMGEFTYDGAGHAVRMNGTVVDITARKQATEALEASEREFRNLAEAMPQIVWVTRPDGWNTFFNQHWVDYTGMILEESMGAGWNTPFHPDDKQRAWDAWQHATATVGTYALECRLRRKDGAYRWWLIRGEPQKDAAGNVIKWFGTCTDIHELKQAELGIVRSNRALRMLSACNEALLHASAESALLAQICDIAVREGGYRMAWVGYRRTEDDRIVTPMASAGHGTDYVQEVTISWREDDPSGAGPAGQVLRGGGAVVIADTAQDPSFAPWREAALDRGYRGVICLPLRDKASTFGILSLYSSETIPSDPAELRLLQELADDLGFGIGYLRAEAARQAVEATLREQAALLDIAQEAIFVKDMEDRIIFWNNGAQGIYGWTREDALGAKAAELLQADPARLREAQELLFAEGKWEGELTKRAQDGRPVTVLVRWTLVRDEAARPKSILAINTDITERKKLEQQFLRAQRMESIGTLAGGIAHDLNNVLAPVMMSIELLRMTFPDEESAEVLRTLQASTQRGADLVKQVLSFARGIDGQRVSVSLGHVMHEIHAVMRDTFPKSVTLDLALGTGIWTVTGDPTQLHQVLLNLCVNARDAMPDGGHLRLALENVVLDEVYSEMNPEARPGAFVRLMVADTGVGIPPAIRERIFDPFFTTKEVGSGTGLGLSTTLGIVKSHGGFIRVYSEEGKGSTFDVYLPANVTPRHLEVAAVEQMPLPRGNGELILVVDDEAGIRAVAQQTLERFGYRVLVASHGAEGVSLYAQHLGEIAAVLTDMAMPIMDGPAMVIALRAMDPQVKIIGSSGLAGNGTPALEGVARFIPKPYSASAILTALKQLLSGT